MNKPLFSFVFFSLITGLLFAQAPTGLKGTGFRTTVHLQWDNYTAFEAVGFNVYRSTISGSYGAPARQVGAYNECTDYNLDPSSTYFYKISAFDGAGNESPLSTEITVATDDHNYTIVASLDLLIPIYTGGMTATTPDEIKASLEHARQFFFRNTFGQLNLNYHYWIIPGYPPFNSIGQATLATIEADLLARGIQPSQYDAVHTMALQLDGFFGGAWYFGGQTAGSMGYDWTHYDPANHYTQGNSWLFTHEFGHALDLVIAYGSGYPEMLFNHFGDNYPLPASIGVFDAGSGFDGMAMILRLFPHHLDYDAPWDGYFEVVDNDGDGMADNDPRVPMDEIRFGSNPNLTDTDNDGLADLAEYFAGTQSSADPTNPDTDNDGLTDGDDVYPVSNFAKLNEKTSGTVVVDGVMGAAEGWHPMVSEPFFSMIPGATLSTFTTWDDNNFYFTFQSNQQLKYFLQMDASGEDGVHQSDVRFPGGNYANLNENSWGDSYFETAELVIRSDGAQVYLKEMPIAGSQVSTTFVGGIYTTEIRLPQNIGPGYGWVYTAPGTPTIAVQSFQEGDIIGIDLTAIPLSEANGNVAAEWFGYYTKKNIILMNDFLHFYDMELVAGVTPPSDYCNAYSNFPWEDWIAHVAVSSIDNASGKTPYSNFTNLSTDLAAGSSPNVSLTTGYSYFTWDEYWRVWIDFNQDGDFSDSGEMAFSGILNAPPNGTQSAILNGNLIIPANAKMGTTRMRVAMKRGGFPTPCEILPFGEIEDYTVNIISGMVGVADLELSAAANPTTISSGYVHFEITLTNQGPAAANNVSVKHSKSGNFFSYNNQTTTIGSFNQITGMWSIPSMPAGATHTLEFDGLIVDMISLQTDFFEVIASSAEDPDSTPNNDLGAKTPDEDDEAAVNLFPSVVADLVVANVNAPSSSNAGDSFDVHFDLKNAGTQPAINSVQAVFLSNDNQWDGSDEQVGISSPITLGPNNILPQTISVSIPAGALTGDYFLLVVADVGNDVLESDESNNIAISPIQIETETPGTYCNSYSEFPWEDWISRVEVANLVNTSGKSYYSDFTAKTANMNAGQSYPVKLGTGYSYFTWDEYWRIWIDFNKDGDFTDAGEMVFSDKLNAPPNGTPKAMLNGTIAIPSNVPTGTTRMRVSMKRNAFATPCEILTFGEVEDYTVNIGSGSNCTIDYATSNTFCQDNGTPNDPADDTFIFDVLVVGTGVSQSWVMTWNGGSTTGVFTVPKTVGPFSIAAFQNGLNFNIADNLDPNCSILGTVFPPQPCSTVLPDCGFSKNYSEGESFTGFFAEQNGSSYRVFGSAGNSVIKLNTDLDGNVASSDIGPSYGTALRDGNFLSISLVGMSVQLTKKNSLGNVIWSNTYPVPNAVSIGLGNVLETPAGDLVVVGSWSATPPPSQHKIFALKTNSTGVQQWLTSSDFNEPTSIPLGVNLVKYTISDGYLISILDHSSEQKYLGKLSPSGALVLEKLVGGFFTDFGDADESANGRIMYSYVSRPAGGPGYNHVGFTVIGASGNYLWGTDGETIAGLISNPGFINFSKPKVTHTADGGFGVSFNGPTAGFYLAKLDADGNIVWNQNATTLDILVPMANFLTEATDGGILLTGQQDGKLWLMKTDAQGGICGPQPPGDYCLPYSNFPWEDWIAKVSLNTLDNSSGKSPYSDFTTISTTVEKGMSYPIQLTTGYSYFTWDEYWSVWIDLNHDHLFTQNELLFSEIMTAPANGTNSKIISGNISIPATAKNGPTRMRVIMKRGAFADPCENIPFGEIEDYTVNIIDNIISPNMGDRATDISFKAVLEKTWVNLFSVFKLPENTVQIEIEKSGDNISFDLLKNINEEKEKNQSHLISAIDEQPFDGLNYYRLLFILGNGEEIYGPVEMVNFNQPFDFTLFPNPASSELFVYLNEKNEGEVKWKINDAFGRQLKSENINQNGEATYRININDFKPGMYYLFVEQTGRKAVGKKFVVAR
jgi:hypothetical protein